MDRLVECKLLEVELRISGPYACYHEVIVEYAAFTSVTCIDVVLCIDVVDHYHTQTSAERPFSFLICQKQVNMM